MIIIAYKILWNKVARPAHSEGIEFRSGCLLPELEWELCIHPAVCNSVILVEPSSVKFRPPGQQVVGKKVGL